MTVIGLMNGLVAAACGGSSGSPSHSASYYVSVGDSLSVGYQPDASGQGMRTNQGYSDDLYLSERSRFPGLQLVKLGCPGETTQTMMHGGICSYPQGSQLAAATAFLQAHRGSLAFLTIDIGANDVDSCATAGQISQACVSLGVASIRTDTPQIVQQLRSAGGPRLPMVGMNLYDPFLQSWLSGAAGQALARLSVTLATSLNQDLASIYHGAGMKTADVAATFATTNFAQVVSVAGHGDVPVNVGRICEWTWMCAPAPVGPNIHANATGYEQIANTFRPLV